MNRKQMRVSNAYLPLEIIYGILLFLSPKNLVQLMCVSRSWRNLIRDPTFVREYLKNSASKGEGFFLYVSMFDGESMSFNLLHDKTFVEEDSRLRIPAVNQWHRNIRIVGSFNGVLCFSEIQFFGFSIYICNPSIGKYKIINPSSTIKIWLVTDMILGFAYHSRVDDFKVVRIAYGTFRRVLGVSVIKNKTDRLWYLCWGLLSQFQFMECDQCYFLPLVHLSNILGRLCEWIAALDCKRWGHCWGWKSYPGVWSQREKQEAENVYGTFQYMYY